MDATIPPVSDLREILNGLGHAQMHELARIANVPFTTLWKVRTGETVNPGIETVRKWLPFVDQVINRPEAA